MQDSPVSGRELMVVVVTFCCTIENGVVLVKNRDSNKQIIILLYTIPYPYQIGLAID